MSEDEETTFRALCEEAGNNPSIIGLYLGGSRGKGFATRHSDYDIYIITQNEAQHAVGEYLKQETSPFHIFCKTNDVMVLTLDGLRTYPPWPHSREHVAYDFARLKTFVDKTNQVQEILDEKAKPCWEKKKINVIIDTFVNYVYRSLKCVRDGLELGARLEANIAMNYLLDILFALHDRPVPYGKYLVWELEQYPLVKLSIGHTVLLDNIRKIWDNADIDAQRFLFSLVEKLSRDAGFGPQIDSWGEKSLQFMRESKKIGKN